MRCALAVVLLLVSCRARDHCFSLGALAPGMLMGTVAFGERNC